MKFLIAIIWHNVVNFIAFSYWLCSKNECENQQEKIVTTFADNPNILTNLETRLKTEVAEDWN